MKTTLRALLIAAVLVSATACGNKGPLVLPKPDSAAPTR
ncbi:MAG: LPS translocon maturation chaperone LptM [Rehaibacterium terrae]|jgi:predicted small lipoprotein YifL